MYSQPSRLRRGSISRTSSTCWTAWPSSSSRTGMWPTIELDADEYGWPAMQATALITGGSGGLGGAVVEEFLTAGWRVVSADRLAGAGSPRGDLERIEADLFDPGGVRAAVERAAGERDAPLGAVVNLVGGFAAGPRV